MRTSNMTEGGPKSSTQKRKKKRTYCPSSCAGTGFFAPSLLPVHIDGSSAGCAALLLPCPLSIHATSKLWQLPCVLVPPTLVPCCRPLSPACVAYFLAPHCCRCCRTKRPLVKVAGVACSAMRVDSISNISIHPSIHPPVHLPMTRQLRTSERLTAVHCMSTSTGYPFWPPPLFVWQ